MADISYDIVFNDGEFLKTGKGIIEMSDSIIEKQKQVGKEFSNTADKAEAAARDERSALKKVERAQKELTKEQIESIKTAKEQAKQFRVFGVSIQDIENKYKGVKSQLAGTFTALRTSGSLWSKLGLILGGLGLGVVAAGLGAVYLGLTRTQDGADRLRVEFAGVKEAAFTLLDGVSRLGVSLVNLFDGDKVRAVDNYKKALEELNGLRDDFDLARIIEQQLIKIRDFGFETRKIFADQRIELRQLKKDAEDTSRSDEARIASARRAYELESELNSRRLFEIESLIRAERRRQDIGENDVTDSENLVKLIEQRSAIQQESIELQTTLNNLINTIEDQRRAALQKQLEDLGRLRDKYNEIQKEIGQGIQDIEFRRLSPRERIEEERDLAIKALDDMEKAAIETASEIAKQTGQFGVPLVLEIAKIQQQFNTLRDTIKLDSQRQIDILPVLPADGIDNLVETAQGELSDREPPKLTIELEPEPLRSSLSKIANNLADLFQSDEFAATIDLGVRIGDAITNIYESQIAGLERLAAEREQRIAELQDQINLEEELLKEGSDANIAAKRDELEQLLVEQENANKKANELRKKQAQIEAAQAIGQQVASTGAAVAQVFQAHSGIPFVGVAIAAGFVATMLATIASANAKIKALALYTGAERIGDYTGYVAKGHSSDRVRPSSGLRVVHPNGKDTGVRLGGNEMLVDEKTTRAIGHIIQDAHKNPSVALELARWYDGVDATPNIVYHSNKIEKYETYQGITKTDLQNVMTEVMDEHLEKHFKKRGKEVAYSHFTPKNGKKGNREIGYKDGTKRTIRGVKG